MLSQYVFFFFSTTSECLVVPNLVNNTDINTIYILYKHYIYCQWVKISVSWGVMTYIVLIYIYLLFIYILAMLAVGLKGWQCQSADCSVISTKNGKTAMKFCTDIPQNKAAPPKHTNAHCLTTAGGQAHKRALRRGEERIVVVANRVQLPHVSVTCLKTPNIIIMNVSNHNGCC